MQRIHSHLPLEPSSMCCGVFEDLLLMVDNVAQVHACHA